MRTPRPDDPDTPEAPEETPGAASAELRAHLAHERGRIERLNRVRQLVFGSLDGLLVPLGVVSGVAAGTHSATAVVVTGVANIVVSAAGDYVEPERPRFPLDWGMFLLEGIIVLQAVARLSSRTIADAVVAPE